MVFQKKNKASRVSSFWGAPSSGTGEHCICIVFDLLWLCPVWSCFVFCLVCHLYSGAHRMNPFYLGGKGCQVGGVVLKLLLAFDVTEYSWPKASRRQGACLPVGKRTLKNGGSGSSRLQ